MRPPLQLNGTQGVMGQTQDVRVSKAGSHNTEQSRGELLARLAEELVEMCIGDGRKSERFARCDGERLSAVRDFDATTGLRRRVVEEGLLEGTGGGWGVKSVLIEGLDGLAASRSNKNLVAQTKRGL